MAAPDASASLYRRHRPQSFGEVVGQEHVVRTLSNAVEHGRVHHAYLFVGSRGTGKTSMAKILARSLNCVNGPTLEPCGECESCRAIAAGTSLDVIEMDAASNRSVDDVRELRERVGYAPAEGRWKVYILDEAHMLTKEAWNAFLKTLEEPPPNTVFVLATTEPQKVMATIVDRTQRFDFQRPSLEQIAEVVRRVAAAEGIEADDGAVALIARSAQGSFRDALGTLDQLVSFGGEKVTTEDVVELLGAADAELLFEATDAIGAGDAGAALRAVETLARSGRDPGQFARDLVAHLRQLLVARATGEVPESFTVTVAQPQRLAEQAGRIGEAKLMGAIDALTAALADMREGDDPRLSLEVALLKLTRPALDSSRQALLRRIEALEQGSAGVAGADRPPGKSSPPADADAPPHASAPADADAPPPADADAPPDAAVDAPPDAAPSTRGQADRPAERPPATGPRTEAASDPPSAPESQPGKGSGPGGPAAKAGEAASAVVATVEVEIERVVELWPAVVDHVRSAGSEMLSTLFVGARPLAVDRERSLLKVGFPASAKFNKRKAEARSNVELIAASVQAVTGHRLRPVYELLDLEHAGGAADSGAELGEEEIIEMIKTNFDARELAEEPDAGARESEAG